MELKNISKPGLSNHVTAHHYTVAEMGACSRDILNKLKNN